MKKYVLKNQNGTVLLVSHNAVEVAKEKREYEYHMQEICTVEHTEHNEYVVNSYTDCLVGYHNKMFNDATDAEASDDLTIAYNCEKALDCFDTFSMLFNVVASFRGSDFSYGFVNSKKCFIDIYNIHKDGDKTPRQIIEGL